MAAEEPNPRRIEMQPHPLGFLGFGRGASSTQEERPPPPAPPAPSLTPIKENHAKHGAPSSRPRFEFEMEPGSMGGPSPPPSPPRTIRKPSPHSSPSMSAIRGLEHEVPPLSLTGKKPPRKAHQGRFFVEVTTDERVAVLSLRCSRVEPTKVPMLAPPPSTPPHAAPHRATPRRVTPRHATTPRGATIRRATTPRHATPHTLHHTSPPGRWTSSSTL